MNILLLYKNYLPLNQCDEYYREPLEKLFGSIKFDVSHLKDNGKKKLPAKEMREWADLAKDTLNQYDYILIADSDWFKTLCRVPKSETTLGMAQNSPNFNSKVFYCPSQYIYQIDRKKAENQFERVLKGIQLDSRGLSTKIKPDIRQEIILFEPDDIIDYIPKLHKYDKLTCDIEAKSLKVTEAGIYTITFCWNKHEGIAFPVDASSEPMKVKQALKKFFSTYKGRLIFHKANYDVYILIYELYMNQLGNIKGQLEGLNAFKNIDDTLVITYLATNSCSGNVLGLKQLAQPYAGDWSVEVSDVTKVPLLDLLRYNLIDGLSTWYIYDTYYPVMVNEEQEDLYKSFMLPTLISNIRCQLNGLPIDLSLVQDFKVKLNREKEDIINQLGSYKTVQNTEWAIAEQNTIKRNSKLKKKQTTVQENFKPINYSSSQDLIVLIHEVMQLPVIKTTESGQSALGKKVLRDLINYTENQEYKDILGLIADLKDVEKISTAFVPTFEEAPYNQLDNSNRLLGYLNICGTVSGRLSSSQPNMQQIPATGSRFAKSVKKLFPSTVEWLFCGCDFNSLESRIDALTTKDPNKLKVFTDGYDSHSINAYAYYKEQMPDIDPTSVESINSIQDKYKSLRQASKGISFALQYGSTAKGLEINNGLSSNQAQEIYNRYHELYKVSLQWKEEKLKQAYIDGYIITGFGLKVRTPFLKGKQYTIDRKGIEGSEVRTAGNALGQGWGVLNDRAMNEVISEIDKLNLSEDILPVCKVHDATYFLVKNDINVLLTLNRLITTACKWNNHPDIYHPQVGLSGQLDLFYPDWSNPITLPENCTEDDLRRLVNEAKETLGLTEKTS